MVHTDNLSMSDRISKNPDIGSAQDMAYANLSNKELMKHAIKNGAIGFARTSKFSGPASNPRIIDESGTPNLVLLSGREYMAQKLAGIPQQDSVDHRNYEIRYFGYGEGGAQEGTGTEPNKIGPFDDDADLLGPAHFASESSDADTHYQYIHSGTKKLIRSDNGSIKIEEEDHLINKGVTDDLQGTTSTTEVSVSKFTAIRYTMYIMSHEFKTTPYPFNEAALYAVDHVQDQTGVESPRGDTVLDKQNAGALTFARFTTSTKWMEQDESLMIEWFILV